MLKRKVLFLCTGNSCRSQMAEAILRHLAADRFEALSAGSHPAGYVHPLAVEAMKRLDIPVLNQDSKSWDLFTETKIDVVITVCDAAAAETCPVWTDSPICVHWFLPDPATHPGTAEERMALALRVADRLRLKLEALAGLDWTLPRDDLLTRLQFLGEI